MKKIGLMFFVLTSWICQGQEVPVIKLKGLQEILEKKDHEILIVNFWATWCAPCVAELPLLEKLGEEKKDIAVYLINLDFVDKIARVKSFIKRKNMKNPVMLLDEIDYNSWINKVDNSWSGAIPATLVINTATGKRKFIAKELNETEIEQILTEIKTQ